jgi:hypothetical protein
MVAQKEGATSAVDDGPDDKKSWQKYVH